MAKEYKKMRRILMNNHKLFYNYDKKGFVTHLSKNIKLNEYLYIYVNLKESDGKRYLNRKHDNKAIFCDPGYLALKKDIGPTIIAKFTFNSVNPNLDKLNLQEASEEKFQLISNKYIEYHDKFRFKKDGFILIYLNSTSGWWETKMDINKLALVVKNIRKYKKNKIILRIHRSDHTKENINKIKKIVSFDKNTVIDCQNYEWKYLLNNCYCIFIQQAKTIFELFAYGVPLFNLDTMLRVNYYPQLYIPLNKINEIEKYKIDRKKILKQIYYTLEFAPIHDWLSLSKKVLKRIKDNNFLK